MSYRQFYGNSVEYGDAPESFEPCSECDGRGIIYLTDEDTGEVYDTERCEHCDGDGCEPKLTKEDFEDF